MDKKYREIEFSLGANIDECIFELLEYKEKGQLVVGTFNGYKLYSDTETLDSAYKKITGYSRDKYKALIIKAREEYKREEEEHKKSIPEKTAYWVKKGKEILDESKWEEWEKIVPIRLHDLYRGLELEWCLNIIELLNKDDIEGAKQELENQNHSGMSFRLVCSLINKFSSNGEEFLESIIDKI